MKLFIQSFIVFLGLLAGSRLVLADVQIQAYKKNYSWKSEWTSKILDELKNEQYRDGENAMLNIEIAQEDLSKLDCAGYNSASLDQKSEFWVVFFSALTRAESAFNEKAKSAVSRGHRSYGLLQLAKQTAKSQCSINPPERDVQNAEDNLRCGIKLMSWQLQGAPLASGKKIRSDLTGHIFGKYMFQWGPLRQNDFKGRALLVAWFKDHIDQLKFCQQKT